MDPHDEYEFRNRIYEKGLFISITGNSESTGFYPEQIVITTTDRKYMKYKDWKKLERAILHILDLADFKTTTDRKEIAMKY